MRLRTTTGTGVHEGNDNVTRSHESNEADQGEVQRVLVGTDDLYLGENHGDSSGGRGRGSFLNLGGSVNITAPVGGSRRGVSGAGGVGCSAGGVRRSIGGRGGSRRRGGTEARRQGVSRDTRLTLRGRLVGVLDVALSKTFSSAEGNVIWYLWDAREGKGEVDSVGSALVGSRVRRTMASKPATSCTPRSPREAPTISGGRPKSTNAQMLGLERFVAIEAKTHSVEQRTKFQDLRS